MGSASTTPFQSSQGPQIKVDTSRTACDVSKYIPPGSFLQIKAYTSAAGLTLFVDFHHVDAQGHVIRSEQQIPLTSARASNPSTIPLAEGYLVAVCVRTNGGSPFIGQTWCRVSLILAGGGVNFIPHTLIQGYVTGTNFTTWPSGSQHTSADSKGFFRSVQGTLPAAGADIAETVPTGAIWRLVCINYSLTCSVAVANRTPGFVIDDGTNVFLNYIAPANVVAASVTNYNAVSGATPSAVPTTEIGFGLPSQLWLPQGFRIRTVTGNIQAADQYTAPNYLVEELIYQ